MAYRLEITTVVTTALYCPVQGVPEVARGYSKGESVVSNEFDESFDMRYFLAQVAANIRPLYSASLSNPTDWKLAWATWEWLQIYSCAYSGRSAYLNVPELMQKAWQKTSDLIDLTSRYIGRASYEAYVKALISLREKAAREAMRAKVVVRIASQESNPDPDGYIPLSQEVIEELSTQDLIVYFSGKWKKKERQDSITVSVPVSRGMGEERLQCEVRMWYGCKKDDDLGIVDQVPSLKLYFNMPDALCGTFNSFATHVSDPIDQQRTYKARGGDVGAKEVQILRGKKFLLEYKESFAKCPMPWKTQASLRCMNNSGHTLTECVDTVFHSQFSIQTVIAKIDWESEQRRLKLSNGYEVMPSDWYEYEIGEEVIVFSPEATLELPLTHEINWPLNGRVIPARIGQVGV